MRYHNDVPTQTVIIDETGLNYAQITVRADSSAAFVPEHQNGSHLYVSILVDGRYYDLVRVVHVNSTPDLVAAFNTAMDRVEQAIAALQPLPFVPTATDISEYDDGLDCERCGTYPCVCNTVPEDDGCIALTEDAEAEIWWTTYEASQSPYHPIAAYEAQEAVRVARRARQEQMNGGPSEPSLGPA